MKRKIFSSIYFFFFFAAIALSVLFLSKSSAFASDVVINEIFPNPPSGEKEWVEFYNTAESLIDLSNYYFDDDDILLVDGQIQKGTSDPGSDPQKLSGILSSKSTCFLDLTSYLNNDKDKPTLFLLNGVVDSYEYNDSIQNKSFSRVPDGADWQADQTSSKPGIQCSSLAPTPTPTPSPTSVSTPTPSPKPTSTPKPTATAKPTATPKLTRIPTTQPVASSTLKISSSPSKTILAGNGSSENSTEETSPGKYVLAANVSSESSSIIIPSASSTPTPKKEVKILASNQNNLSKVLISVGVILLIICGILAFRTYKKGKYE